MTLGSPAPLIGITCDQETITDRRGCPAPRLVCPQDYVKAVERTGGVPLLLPHIDECHLDRVAELCDGFVFAGGDFDIPPEYFGARAHPKLGRLQPERTRFEHALMLRTVANGVPFLGICGGMQLLNVLAGGSLHQDLSDRPQTGIHEQPEDRREPFHGVKLVAGTKTEAALGASQVHVNSTHHQIVADLGANIQGTGHAPDGVIEAIELTNHPFAIGVQWHPEALSNGAHDGLYRALVEAAQKPSK